MSKLYLPDHVPLLAPSNVLLLPGTIIPVEMLEKPNLKNASVFSTPPDGENKKFVGIVQMTTDPVSKKASTKKYVGCVGRVTDDMLKNDSNKMQIQGVCRFHLNLSDITQNKAGYMESKVDYSKFVDSDLTPHPSIEIDRKQLLIIFKEYADKAGVMIDFNVFDSIENSILVDALCMACPFDRLVRQDLLEQERGINRANRLLDFLKIAKHKQLSQVIN